MNGDKNMKKIGKEFKEFISRGNVVDLAVGVIIGGAFQAIVNALINNLLMPFIGLLTGGIDFAEQFIILKCPEGVDAATVTSSNAAELGVTIWGYGAFIAAVINFIIMAIVVFLIVKVINTIKKKAEKPAPEAAPTTKVCPFCKSEIAIDATRCPHCTSEQPVEEEAE